MITIQQIIGYMLKSGMAIFTTPGHVNIVYLEGVSEDMEPNADAPDQWNDVRLVFTHNDAGAPTIVHTAAATTEPGRLPTNSAEALKRGGVARIAFGQYTAWKIGYHNQRKNGRNHPALVQCRPVSVHRDRNRDMKRTCDTVHVGMFGINQHSTRPGWNGESVGYFSEGCLVGKNWEAHVDGFMPILKADPRYRADNDFVFTAAVLDGSKVSAFI